MRRCNFLVAACFMFFASDFSSADEVGSIEAVYGDSISYYTESGKKQGQLEDDRAKNLVGRKVLQKGSRGLVQVELGGDVFWVRSSQLKIALGKQQKTICIEAAQRNSTDRATPVSSGLGGDGACKKQGAQ